MKRSEINRHIEQAKKLFAQNNFQLPPFAYWTPQQWQNTGHEADEIRTYKLGWDVTDFGEGPYEKVGLLLFTLRNGRVGQPGKQYAEKIMITGESQLLPFHFHWLKTEDIINRGKTGRLVIELYNSTPDGAFANTPVTVSCDGITRTVPPGGQIILGPGESITLVPGVYHAFYGQAGGGPALIGEVSSVNDDATDNRFHKPLGRYPKIIEDEPPIHLLCNEYPLAKRE